MTVNELRRLHLKIYGSGILIFNRLQSSLAIKGIPYASLVSHANRVYNSVTPVFDQLARKVTPVALKLARVFLLAMETTYTIVDQPAQSAKRGGVFLTYKIIAVVAVIVLVVVVALVLLAAFLGPGRKRSCSEECSDGDGKTKKGKACTQRSRLFYRARSFFG